MAPTTEPREVEPLAAHSETRCGMFSDTVWIRMQYTNHGTPCLLRRVTGHEVHRIYIESHLITLI